MEQEVAEAVAEQAATQAKLSSAAQAHTAATEQATAAHAESHQPTTEEHAAESQGQLLSHVRGIMKMARDGIKQRQTALQYARSTWQVPPPQPLSLPKTFIPYHSSPCASYSHDLQVA